MRFRERVPYGRGGGFVEMGLLISCSSSFDGSGGVSVSFPVCEATEVGDGVVSASGRLAVSVESEASVQVDRS